MNVRCNLLALCGGYVQVLAVFFVYIAVHVTRLLTRSALIFVTWFHFDIRHVVNALQDIWLWRWWYDDDDIGPFRRTLHGVNVLIINTTRYLFNTTRQRSLYMSPCHPVRVQVVGIGFLFHSTGQCFSLLCLLLLFTSVTRSLVEIIGVLYTCRSDDIFIFVVCGMLASQLFHCC